MANTKKYAKWNKAWGSEKDTYIQPIRTGMAPRNYKTVHAAARKVSAEKGISTHQALLMEATKLQHNVFQQRSNLKRYGLPVFYRTTSIADVNAEMTETQLASAISSLERKRNARGYTKRGAEEILAESFKRAGFEFVPGKKIRNSGLLMANAVVPGEEAKDVYEVYRRGPKKGQFKLDKKGRLIPKKGAKVITTKAMSKLWKAFNRIQAVWTSFNPSEFVLYMRDLISNEISTVNSMTVDDLQAWLESKFNEELENRTTKDGRKKTWKAKFGSKTK